MPYGPVRSAAPQLNGGSYAITIAYEPCLIPKSVAGHGCGRTRRVVGVDATRALSWQLNLRKHPVTAAGS